jgi:hypothetical protein
MARRARRDRSRVPRSIAGSSATANADSRASARDVARIRAQREPASLGDELFERTRGAPALVDRVIAHALTRTPKTLGDGELCEALDAAGL